MDYNLEGLDPERFQQLVQALLVSEYPGMACFPVAQPDGGRDALQVVRTDNRTHIIIFQVKFARNPASVPDVNRWLVDKTKQEMEKIERLKSRGAAEYVVITNLSGTAHLDVGTIDRTLNDLGQQLHIPVRCWWRDDINRRLDGHWDLKLRYPEVLTGQDFLRLALEQKRDHRDEQRLNAIRAFLIDQYEEDVDVKFKQVELHNKLLDLFIDLPFRLTIKTTPDLNSSYPPSHFYLRLRMRHDEGAGTITLTNTYEDETVAGTATLLLSDFPKLNQVVVEGAPGQGKSTLAQYICQVHRIRFLNKTEDQVKIPAHDLHSPLHLPLKVDLRDFASWMAGTDPFAASEPSNVSDPRSLETFLSRLVRHHSGGISFDTNDLLKASEYAPLLIVLDGLDEVPDAKHRSDVITAITKSTARLRENCPHTRVVVTSRPAAFVNSPGFGPIHFVHIELMDVKRSQITSYATRWMDARKFTDKERREFWHILSERLDAPHLRDLARNPMQLAILLSLILTEGSALPDKRTTLYGYYVDRFFSREAAKSGSVRRHIDLLKDIHCFLGWALHSTAETSRKSAGRITASELKTMLRKYLKREKQSAEIVDEIFDSLHQRVGMIVSRIQGTYEFEVQPLREYFAAKYLYDTAPYSPTGKEKKGTKPDRFDAIARNFYWLNVTRFFAGCFSKGELLDLADRVHTLIDDPLLGQSRHSVTLAAMLLSDWVFSQSPKAVKEVATALMTPNSILRLSAPDSEWSGEPPIQGLGGRMCLNGCFNYWKNLNDTQTRAEDLPRSQPGRPTARRSTVAGLLVL